MDLGIWGIVALVAIILMVIYFWPKKAPQLVRSVAGLKAEWEMGIAEGRQKVDAFKRDLEGSTRPPQTPPSP